MIYKNGDPVWYKINPRGVPREGRVIGRNGFSYIIDVFTVGQKQAVTDDLEPRKLVFERSHLTEQSLMTLLKSMEAGGFKR